MLNDHGAAEKHRNASTLKWCKHIAPEARSARAALIALVTHWAGAGPTWIVTERATGEGVAVR